MCNKTNLKMSVESAAFAAAKQLGALKDLQLEVIKGIATGRDVFAVLPKLAMARAYVMVVCP